MAIASIGMLMLVLICFVYAKDLVLLLQEPVAEKGVRFLQLTPGEYFFTTVKVCLCAVSVRRHTQALWLSGYVYLDRGVVGWVRGQKKGLCILNRPPMLYALCQISLLS